jgi:hypothetical protein
MTTGQKIQLVAVFLVVGAVVLLAPGLIKGILAVGIGVAGLIAAVLLKVGKTSPGGTWSGETPLGMVLISIALLGFGTSYLFEALAADASMARLPAVAVLIMIACLPFGLVLEWKAWKARRTGAP